MDKISTAERLKQYMKENSLKQKDILDRAKPFCKKYNIKLEKNDLSQYVAGKVEPSQKKLTILSYALDVDPTWLMGYDVPQKSVNKESTQIVNFLNNVKYEKIEESVKCDKKNGSTLVSILDFEDVIFLFFKDYIKTLNLKIKELEKLMQMSKNVKNSLSGLNYIIGTNGEIDNILSFSYGINDKKDKLIMCIRKEYTDDELLTIIAKNDTFNIIDANSNNEIEDLNLRKKAIKHIIDKFIDFHKQSNNKI